MKKSLILLGSLLLFGLLCSTAQASMARIERYNYYSISFDNPSDFANAKGYDDILQTWSGDVGDSVSQTFSLLPTAYNVGMVGDSNMGVTNVVWSPPDLSATISALTGSTGQTDIHLEYSASGDVGVSGGYYYLEVRFSSAGGVDNGYPYYWQMVVPGDWSASGTGSGQHELLSFNSAYWLIDKDFLFDGTNTTFLAHASGGYQGENINIDFLLHGGTAPIPIPATIYLLGSGLLGMVAFRRRFYK